MNQKQSIELILQDQVAILEFRSPSPDSSSSSESSPDSWSAAASNLYGAGSTRAKSPK